MLQIIAYFLVQTIKIHKKILLNIHIIGLMTDELTNGQDGLIQKRVILCIIVIELVVHENHAELQILILHLIDLMKLHIGIEFEKLGELILDYQHLTHFLLLDVDKPLKIQTMLLILELILESCVIILPNLLLILHNEQDDCEFL